MGPGSKAATVHVIYPPSFHNWLRVAASSRFTPTIPIRPPPFPFSSVRPGELPSRAQARMD